MGPFTSSGWTSGTESLTQTLWNCPAENADTLRVQTFSRNCSSWKQNLKCIAA